MLWRRSAAICIGCLLCIAVSGYSQVKRFGDEAELSYVDTGGNTDIVNFAAKNAMKYKFAWNLEGFWKIGALYGKSDGDKNAENYYTEFRLDYLFSERFYSALIAGWLRDRFAGIDERYYMGPALGYYFLAGPVHMLSGEVGLNYVSDDYIDDTENDYFNGRAYAVYEYLIAEKNKFTQSMEFLYNLEQSKDYNINSQTAFINHLQDYLSLKISYVINFDNEPVPSSLKETDTILSVSIILTY
jgi:putative salt-induced outer membrane protein